MRLRAVVRSVLLALSSVAMWNGACHAQEAASAASAGEAPSGNELDEIVVTATPTVSGIRKLDASFAISTASLQEIHDSQPSSAADVLKIVPGLWAESSGGASGANIEVAGFPSGGSGGAPFVTFELDGSPIYPTGLIGFLEPTQMLRLDNTIERQEVVLGGPSSVYSTGQIGTTANYILRRGTATPHGDIGLTVGDEGLYRVDGFYGAPLAPDWFVSVGGFYRYSNGIRDSQFPSDNGGQLTATLAHNWEGGSVLFFARFLNDENAFITDIPLSVSGTGSSTTVSAFPGFNPNTGTFVGDGTRGISVVEAPGAQPTTADLAHGRGANLHIFGNNLDLDVAKGISLSNKLMYVAGDVDCSCLFNNATPPQTLSSYINGQIASANTNPVITGMVGPASSGTGRFVTSGANVNPNALVATVGFWIVKKQVQSFTDELRGNFELFPGNNLTLGGYLAAYSSHDQWYLGNTELMTATPNAQLINLTLNNGVQVTNPAGLVGGSFYSYFANWNGLITALYASDQWKLDRWLLDAGVRLERQKDHGSVENQSTKDITANPLELWTKGYAVPNGTYTQGVSCDSVATGAACTEYAKALASGTVGVNYELSDRMSVYVRATHGVHFPSFSVDLAGGVQAPRARSYEVGFRVQTATLYASIDAFHRDFTGEPFQQFAVVNGQGVNVTAHYGAKTTGLTFEGRWQPIREFSINLTGDWQHGRFTDFSSVDLAGTSYTGNRLDRQPQFQLRVTPQYETPVPWGYLRVFGTYSYVGLRYSDIANLQVLPAFYTLDAGIVSEIGQNFELRLQGTNLTNQIGLTEGNARVALGSSNGIAGGFEYARPIFGREVNFQVMYRF